MFRWARPFIVILAMLAVVAAGVGGAVAAKASHNCEGMPAGMVMDDCPGGDADNGAMMSGCAALICASAQMVVPPLDVFFSPKIITTFAQPLPRNDIEHSGLRGPPDLRPPIA
jgi:hypothetical protein